MRRELLAALLFAALTVPGCEHRPAAPSAPPAPAESPVPGPRLVLPDGSAVALELAIDNDTRAQGLMYRESLLPGRGMLFIFPAPGRHSFWMKNTLIPLDMMWMDAAGTVVAIHQNVPPCRADPCPNYDPGTDAAFALELAGGEAAKHRVAVGRRVQLPDLSAVRVR